MLQLMKLNMNIVSYHTADRQSCLQLECAMQTSLLGFAQIVRGHFHHKSNSGICAVILVITTRNTTASNNTRKRPCNVNFTHIFDKNP